jgi:NADH:ubiquinone oxidoreductase subunit E
MQLEEERMSSKEAEIRDKTKGILENLESKRENLIPILQQIQEEFGYLPPDAMPEVARFLNIPEIDVYSAERNNTASSYERGCIGDFRGRSFGVKFCWEKRDLSRNSRIS